MFKVVEPVAGTNRRDTDQSGCIQTQCRTCCTEWDGVQYPGRKMVKIMAAGNAYQRPKRYQTQSETIAPTAGTRTERLRGIGTPRQDQQAQPDADESDGTDGECFFDSVAIQTGLGYGDLGSDVGEDSKDQKKYAGG